MSDVLLVDGYNVIYYNKYLKSLFENNMEDSRTKLVATLSSYAGFKGYLLIIVFDAHQTAGLEEKWEQISSDVHMVFTKKGETADTVIERLVYEMQGLHQVWVATSDKEEQYYVLAKGAARISARELWFDVKRVQQQMQIEYIKRSKNRKRNRLLDVMNQDVMQKLEKLRRKR